MKVAHGDTLSSALYFHRNIGAKFAPMHGLQAKRTKRAAKIFKSHGFRPPFQVLVDKSFAKGTCKSPIGPRQFAVLLRGECKFSIPACEYEKYKKHRRDGDITGQCEIIKCKTTEEHTDCIFNIIGKTNAHHFFLATSDDNIAKRAVEVPNLPLIRTRNSAIYVTNRQMERITAVNTGKPADGKELRRLRKTFGCD